MKKNPNRFSNVCIGASLTVLFVVAFALAAIRGDLPQAEFYAWDVPAQPRESSAVMGWMTLGVIFSLILWAVVKAAMWARD